jgi:hypothetical protein
MTAATNAARLLSVFIYPADYRRARDGSRP